MYLDSDPKWINRDARQKQLHNLISSYQQFSVTTTAALGQFPGRCPPFKLLLYKQFEFPDRVVTITTQQKNVPILRDVILELNKREAMTFLIRNKYCYTIKEFTDNLRLNKNYAVNTINQHVRAVEGQHRESIWNAHKEFLDMPYLPADGSKETTIRQCLEQNMHLEPHFQVENAFFAHWQTRQNAICTTPSEENARSGS